MKNNTIVYIVGALVVLVIGGVFLSTGRTVTQPVAKTPQTTIAVTPASVPTKNDPQDIVPGMYPNPIQNTATIAGLSIVSGFVENNIDATGKVTDDHLELLLKNDSKQDMSNVEVYYTVTDPTTGKSEGYYKKLAGFVLKAGESTPIHFDGKNAPGHFGVNKDGLYFTSKDSLQFTIEVSTPNFKIAHLDLKKDAGGAEVKD